MRDGNSESDLLRVYAESFSLPMRDGNATVATNRATLVLVLAYL